MRQFLKRIILPVFVIMLYLLLEQCKHKPVYPVKEICFESKILPIFISNCTMSGCHGNGSAEGGLVLDNYNGIMQGVKPGDAEDSDIYESITGQDELMPPPPRPSLSDEQIQLIYDWIQSGAKNTTNCTENTCDTTNVTYSNQIATILNNYCTGCHNTNNASGGWDLSNYNGVKASVDAGRFWGAVNWEPGFSAMPKNGNQLSVCDLRAIKLWLDAGAQNN
tara:strand:+ start:24263 stop:24925 length:663 start_codon:yes stop_codon:yes gene_type:complete